MCPVGLLSSKPFSSSFSISAPFVVFQNPQFYKMVSRSAVVLSQGSVGARQFDQAHRRALQQAYHSILAFGNIHCCH